MMPNEAMAEHPLEWFYRQSGILRKKRDRPRLRPNRTKAVDSEVWIYLTQGFRARIDLADAERVLKCRWWARVNGNGVYPSAAIDGKHVQLHRFLLGARPGQIVDHANGDTLDNRRCNLRFCSHGQNVQNSRPCRGRRFKGVVKVKGRPKNSWRARIRVDNKQICLGTHPTEEAAALAYDAAARLHFGEFARLNFPQEQAA